VRFREVGAIRGEHSGATPTRHAAMSTATATATASASIADVVAHRAYLVRFAMRRLRDPMLAEDAVHDVFEAVLSGRAAFAGRAALRSWLTAVLKNKIVDSLRRSPMHESLDGDDDGEGAGRPGHDAVCPLPGPEEVAEQRELLGRALAAIDALPSGLRDAIRLRVIEDRSAESACKELGISEENLFVRVHRARKRLLS
jgi:RNA polymerase sigma-70 factor, ECF subfamily